MAGQACAEWSTGYSLATQGEFGAGLAHCTGARNAQTKPRTNSPSRDIIAALAATIDEADLRERFALTAPHTLPDEDESR